ncbi:MAG TPA: hypothetical protein ENH87_00490 [Pricia antarctica]|uniref:Bacteriophage T5 Orf172 DNA-binding domain-containing protein n=2 Tax=root TaxID=1 RepID=A0A831QJD7_9FLAO|nr:hypothetical protein [Pricia antarctica]
MPVNDGYVYLVKLPFRNLYKIGRTQYPEVRLKGHVAGSEMLACALCPDYKTVERDLRNRYKSKLVKGREWFNLSVSQIKEVISFLNAGALDMDLLNKIAIIRKQWELIDTFLLSIQIKQRRHYSAMD